MNFWVLLLIAFLTIVTVGIWTFATAALYRRGQCRVYPYYWCDTNWACCTKDNQNSNCVAAGGTSGNSYKITDKYYGTETDLNKDEYNSYNHLCIAPANAIIATYPGTASLTCLYDNTVACPGTGSGTDFNAVPGYNASLYNPTTNPNGLRGRCEYYSIDDPVPKSGDPTPPPYLPLYSDTSKTEGVGYYSQPYLGSGASSTNNTNYYFAGNSGVNVSTNNGWANGPNQADTKAFSAWNRLSKNTASGPNN